MPLGIGRDFPSFELLLGRDEGDESLSQRLTRMRRLDGDSVGGPTGPIRRLWSPLLGLWTGAVLPVAAAGHRPPVTHRSSLPWFGLTVAY